MLVLSPGLSYSNLPSRFHRSVSKRWITNFVPAPVMSAYARCDIYTDNRKISLDKKPNVLGICVQKGKVNLFHGSHYFHQLTEELLYTENM